MGIGRQIKKWWTLNRLRRDYRWYERTMNKGTPQDQHTLALIRETIQKVERGEIDPSNPPKQPGRG